MAEITFKDDKLGVGELWAGIARLAGEGGDDHGTLLDVIYAKFREQSAQLEQMRLFLTTMKEDQMSAKDDFKREMAEQRAQTGAIVEAFNLQRSLLADIKGKLDAALAASADGLSPEETAAAAADLDAGQKEIEAALAGGNVQVPTDPAEPVVLPETQVPTPAPVPVDPPVDEAPVEPTEQAPTLAPDGTPAKFPWQQ